MMPMAYKLAYGAVMDGPRKVIHAVRVLDAPPSIDEIDDLLAQMRDRMLARHGEQSANVVLIVGDSKETLRLFGEAHAMTRVRTAMFNAAISWSDFDVG